MLTKPLDMFFDDLEEIGRAYESKEFMRTVMIKGPYQCGTSVFQLAKLRILESYYGFNEYFSRQDFELYYMDTDSFYLAISGDSFRWEFQGWGEAGISGRQEKLARSRQI